MNNPLVIVDISRVDSQSESTTATPNDRGIWLFTLPQDASQMAEQTVSRLNAKVCEKVHTVIVCSSADDSYARYRSTINDRARPRDVLGALGVNLAIIMKKYLPNMQNIFKAEAACASGLIALELADMIARTHDAVVLIAGVDKSTAPIFLNLFYYIGAVATEPNKYYSPFDQQRAGFAMGEGAAMLAVTTASYAAKQGLDVIAVINSVNTQTIMTHPTAPSDPVLLEQFIRRTISNSGINSKDFACWDAHATATPQGDELEYQIFSNIFQEDIAISSYKSRVGHCMSASAVVEIVNAVEHLLEHKVSPNYNLIQPISDDPRLITQETSTLKKTFIKTSFGFGGRNGAAVITVK